MNKNAESGKYYLENELRTWSELKKRAAAIDAADADSNGNAARPTPQSAQSPVSRRWGGCAFGCDHDKIKFPRRVRRRDTSDIMNGDGNITKPADKTSQSLSRDGNMSYQSHHPYHHTTENGSLLVNEEPSAPPKTTNRNHDVANYNLNHVQNSIPEEVTGLAYTQPAFTSTQNGSSDQNDWARNYNEHKMSYLYVDGNHDNGNYLGASSAALQLGRDGGGTLSGAASPTGIKLEEDDYFISTMNLSQTPANAASSLSRHSPSFSSTSLPPATANTPHQPQQQEQKQQQQQEQQQQRQTQHQSSSTEHPCPSSSSSPSAAAAAAAAAAVTATPTITPSSTPSHPPPPTYQLTPEKWTSQSGMGAGAQAEPLGDYSNAGDGINKMEENGERDGKITEGLEKMGDVNGGGGRGGEHFKAVQRAEERSNSVGESVY